MEQSRRVSSRSLFCAAIGLLFSGLALFIVATPAASQPADASALCTPDVMRLCSQFIPSTDRIVGCLKAKRSELSPGCKTVMTPPKKWKGKKRRVREARDQT